MKFRYFLCFSVSLELTLGDYCLDQANSSSLNDSLGEDRLHHNSCIIAILLFYLRSCHASLSKNHMAGCPHTPNKQQLVRVREVSVP